MTVAVVDGDPPLPPEHIHPVPCVSDITWDEKESKHSDASFFLTPNLPGTETYDANTVEKFNGRRNSDHEPPSLQPRQYLRSEKAHAYNNAHSHSPTRTTTIKNLKNTKTTTYATTHNDNTSTARDATPTRRPPPFQPTASTYTPPPPQLTTAPPQRIDLDALKASILAGLIRDTAHLTTMPTTQTTMLPTTPFTPPPAQTNETPLTPPTLTITPSTQRIDLDELKASILAGLLRDTASRTTMPITPMTTTIPPTTTTTPSPAPTNATPPLTITPSPQRIDLNALKASIRAGVIHDTTLRTTTKTPMPTTQPMPTLKPQTTTPENTVTPANTTNSDPTRPTANAPTFHQPQPPPPITTDAAHAAEDHSPVTMRTTVKQSTTPTPAHTATTEKTTPGDTPATAPTFYQPTQLLKFTDDELDTIGYLPTLLPTTTTTEQTSANTKTTEQTSIVNPSTSHKTLPMMQSTVNITDDAEDDISTTQPMTMRPTAMRMTTNTEMNEKTTIDDAPATTSSPPTPHYLPHVNDASADNTAIESLMLLPTTLKPTTNDATTTKTMFYIPDRPTANDDILRNPPQLKQPPVVSDEDVEHEFESLIPTTPMTTTPPTLIPDYLSPDSNTTGTTTHLCTTTINWVRDNYAPVFEALHRLEIEIVKLTHRVFAVTSNINTAYHPIQPTPNQQPHCHQPQFLCSSTYKRHHRETSPSQVSNPRNRTQTIQQKLQPQRTHHCHRNHTKHRNFLWPLSHIFDSHFRKYLSLPVTHIHLPNYLRYLAHNFQPP